MAVFCIASGAMISSGLFILPGIAFAYAGPALPLSYFFAGILALFGMACLAELISAMPKAGGDYFITVRTLGPAVGTVSGLVTWLSLSLKSAFALVGVIAFLKLLLPGAPGIVFTAIGIIICALFVWLNIAGVKEAGAIQTILVVVLLLLLAGYLIISKPVVSVSKFQPFLPRGWAAVFSTAGFVFVSFGGLLQVASIAEEVKRPSWTLPLGTLLSLGVAILLYVLAVFATIGVMDAHTLQTSTTPLSDGAAAALALQGFSPAWCRLGFWIIGIAAIIAFITTANAGIMSASRYPFSLSRDGLLPGVFSRIHTSFHSPYFSIIITGLVIAVSLFLPLETLVKAASSVMILTNLFCCASVVILRESRIQNYRPSFKVPLYPWIPLLGGLGFVCLLAGMGRAALITTLMLVFGGLLIYFIYGRRQVSREYALLHLIERITAKELTSRSIENELRDILHERDEIKKDRFDHLVEQAAVLDLPGRVSAEELFTKAAGIMAAPLTLPVQDFARKLLDREQQSSTVLSPFLAIPHLVVDGSHSFALLIARSSVGIWFSDRFPAVHAVFILAGTLDERQFHLLALAAVAGIVQNPSFEQYWLQARTEQDLRDILLLGKRKRFIM